MAFTNINPGIRYNFNADAMLDDARQAAGLSDLGSWDYHSHLCNLIECVERDANLTESGAQILKADVRRNLINALRMQDDIKRHPEILEEDISDPIVIVSIPRSGTTKLHKMLSAPATVQKTLLWRLWNPAPFPDAVAGEPDPRIRAAGTSQLLSKDIPALETAHRIAEHEVEEESNPYQMSFANWGWVILAPSPSYFDWCMSNAPGPAYRYAKTVFQYLQWQDGGKRGRPWVFKYCLHMAHLDTLLETYPKATVITTHRDPLSSVPSYIKLQALVAAPYIGEPDLPAVGQEVMRNWSEAMRRYLAVRNRLGNDERIIDVDYEQIRVNPMPIMHEIYERHGYTMSPDAERVMRDWHNNNEQGKHGKHVYSLAECGLTEADVERTYAEYIERFIRR